MPYLEIMKSTDLQLCKLSLSGNEYFSNANKSNVFGSNQRNQEITTI